MSKTFTQADVLKHNDRNDLFLVIHNTVYDVTKFADEHPGGDDILVDVAGQDATETFEDVGHSDDAREILAGLQVGTLKKPIREEKDASKVPGRNISGGVIQGLKWGFVGVAASVFVGTLYVCS